MPTSTNPSLEKVCLPCWQGEHGGCRHRPDGPRFGRAPEGTPCSCEISGHVLGKGTCSDVRMSEFSSLHRCGRPAKETVGIRPYFSDGRRRLDEPLRTVYVERCGMHLAGIRRAAENDRKREEDRRARQESYERQNQLDRSSADWARRLRETFGLDAEPLHGRKGALRVAVEPEALHGLLDEVVGLLRDAGIEDHPLRP